MPIVLVVFNNNGIYGGMDEETFKEITEEGDSTLVTPPTSLMPAVR